eukprot:TRINITY_DN3314_c3_g3_i1.p1 TRINITY_DN3314_c3_g3~~TRINITY_DN3314_c3_g3_i1.p1  ORF type:complete len:324 (+),score=90.51 TRINITY_DN3314_c3_g3_i1:52-1023(+)
MIDYYLILEINNKNATQKDIKKAYRRLALIWHPDKNPNNKEEATEKFSKINEAYEVLGDPEKRAVYDRFGLQGLKQGIPKTDGGMYGGDFVFHDPFSVFEEFFGTNNPFFSSFFEPTQGFSNEFPNSNIFSKYSKMGQRKNAQKSDDIVHEFNVTLEELYNGTTKHLKVSGLRRLSEDQRSVIEISKTYSVDITPNLSNGTRFRFENEGPYEPENIQGDLIFVMNVLPHEKFEKVENNLVHNVKITLKEALLGKGIDVHTLDGRVLKLSVSDIVSPNSTLVVESEGFFNEDYTQKGDLVVKFQVIFPAFLSEKQKSLISQALP